MLNTLNGYHSSTEKTQTKLLMPPDFFIYLPSVYFLTASLRDVKKVIIRTTGTDSSGEDLLLVEFFVDIPSCQTVIALTTPADASIGFVKILVQEDESIAFERQYMLLNGKELHDTDTIHSIGLRNEGLLQLVKNNNHSASFLENNLLKNPPEFNSGDYTQEPGAQDRGHTSQPIEVDLWWNDDDDEFHLTWVSGQLWPMSMELCMYTLIYYKYVSGVPWSSRQNLSEDTQMLQRYREHHEYLLELTRHSPGKYS
ncbi:hypothetical protein CPB85DRAFT_1257204 [Mucidula mucida]|nr:hypothetical protein CPB85DRAFT_1257204 [Mucidula mucida]